MASGTEEFQFAVPSCSEHSNEEFFSYCNTCNKRICEVCVKGTHKEHDWTSISKHARKLRREGMKMSEKIREEILPSLRATTGKARRESNRNEIIQTQENFKEAIDTYAHYLLSVVDDDTDDEQDLEKKIEQFMKFADFFEENIHSANDNLVLDMEEEFNDKMDEHRKSAKQITGVRSFEKGVLVVETLKHMFGRMMFGNLDDAKVVTKFVKSLKIGTKAIIGIMAKSEKRAWIQVFDSSINTLIEETGKSILDIEFDRGYNSFIIEGRSHIFTSNEEQAVLKCTNGKICTVYDTSPFYSSGLCRSKDGGLLVCLIEDDRSEVTSTTKGEVHHIDMEGKIIRKYATEKDSKSALFRWPNKVAQNVNLDVCVLDYVGEKENDRLVVVSVDGKLRFTYSGQPTMKERFVAGNVICDAVGRIFVTDTRNDAIYILNADGNFLQYLLKDEDGIDGPCSLSFHKNTMWVAFKKGVVNIYRIK